MNLPFPLHYPIAILMSANMLHLVKHDPAVPDQKWTQSTCLKYRCIIDDIVECVRELEKPWEIAGGFGTLLIACDRDDRDEWLRSIDLPA